MSLIKYTPEQVVEELRKCYKYITENDNFMYQLKHYFDKVSSVPYPIIMKYARKSQKIRDALDKLYEINRVKEVEKMYSYLNAMKKWFEENKDKVFVLEFFEEKPAFTRQRIEKMAEENELIRQAWEELLALQEIRIIKAMLKGRSEKKYIFILKNMHGWKDKQEIDVTDNRFRIKVERESIKSEDYKPEPVDVKEQYNQNNVIKLEANAKGS